MFALYGNRLSIEEPNAGAIASTYNGFNELIQQIDARNDTTAYQYDKLGRVTQKRYSAPNFTPLTLNYIYDNYSTNNRGRGKLYQIKQNNAMIEEFTYDTLSRVVKSHKLMYGYFKYTYTPYGLLTRIQTGNKKIREIINWK